jgi:hypothetical protein
MGYKTEMVVYPTHQYAKHYSERKSKTNAVNECKILIILKFLNFLALRIVYSVTKFLKCTCVIK